MITKVYVPKKDPPPKVYSVPPKKVVTKIVHEEKVVVERKVRTPKKQRITRSMRIEAWTFHEKPKRKYSSISSVSSSSSKKKSSSSSSKSSSSKKKSSSSSSKKKSSSSSSSSSSKSVAQGHNEYAYIPAGGYQARIVQPRMVDFYKPVYIQNFERHRVPADAECVTYSTKKVRMARGGSHYAGSISVQGNQGIGAGI